MDIASDSTQNSRNLVSDVTTELSGANSEYESGVDNADPQKNSEVEVIHLKFF